MFRFFYFKFRRIDGVYIDSTIVKLHDSLYISKCEIQFRRVFLTSFRGLLKVQNMNSRVQLFA